MKIRKGFTLIELLVVVAIIAILSAVGLSTFVNAQRRARDSRRRADMLQIQNAMEQYYLLNNAYPNLGGGYTELPATYWSSGSYPRDPRATPGGYGQTGLSATAYTVCADLELTAAGAINPLWSGTRTSGSDIFCVKNLQ